MPASYRLNFIKKIRAHDILKNATFRQQKKTLDYVQEMRLPVPISGKNILEHLFHTRRPLNPRRKEYEVKQKILSVKILLINSPP